MRFSFSKSEKRNTAWTSRYASFLDFGSLAGFPTMMSIEECDNRSPQQSVLLNTIDMIQGLLISILTFLEDFQVQLATLCIRDFYWLGRFFSAFLSV